MMTICNNIDNDDDDNNGITDDTTNTNTNNIDTNTDGFNPRPEGRRGAHADAGRFPAD